MAMAMLEASLLDAQAHLIWSCGSLEVILNGQKGVFNLILDGVI